MANTEKITAFQIIRDAKVEVRKARREKSLSDEENTFLENLFNDLDEIEGHLIIAEINECIQKLQADRAKIEKISQDIKQKIQKLSAVADKLDKVTKAIKILVDVISKAGTLGAL